MLRTLFKKRNLDELRGEADALFAEERYGEAKLAYDRVAERAEKESRELAAEAEARAVECCDRIGLTRAEQARKLHAQGHGELAQEELKHARETARGDAALARIGEIARELERAEAVEHAREPAPLSDEEQLMLITSSWEPLQARELERYGEPLFEALLAIDRGQGERAVALLQELAKAASEPSYLWLELGRAQLACHALDEAERALGEFLARIGPEEGGGARLLAHRELARIAHERGDHEAAVAQLEAAAAALADDPRPLLDLGNYLRVIERPRDAVEVLELCTELFGEGEIEWPVTMELGLACAAAGDAPRALRVLEGMLEGLLAKGHTDLPPPAAVALARLHEQGGNPARAADLYRALTQGSDVGNHGAYYLEAGRLLDVLNLTDEASLLRARARALGAEPQTPQAVEASAGASERNGVQASAGASEPSD